MNKIIYQGLISALLATAFSIGYYVLYQSLFGTKFDQVINYGSIAGASLAVCISMSTCYHVTVKKYSYKKAAGWLNLAFAVISIASLMLPLSISLPLEIETPELFPGLAIPMHLFPVIAFLAIAPFFKPEGSKYY